ncbi:hypothetical protein [Maritimibacter sp. UBA3975]|uniref:hypothetical protein n=1 Tax=Maritimibacter sp. UBA3975 TaxID=1946833 RepID=UPI000C0B7AEB|nr:hypothetical protein [Maritimibacter sp. UBA3975]MAM63944.1 hypothetical protein [Maritimibacter sp.]
MIAIGAALVAISGCDTVGGRADAFADAYNKVAADFALANVNSTLPTSGQASYSGLAMVAASANMNNDVFDSYVGTSEFTASFNNAGGNISGKMSDFAVREMVANNDPDAKPFFDSLSQLDSTTTTQTAASIAAFFSEGELANGEITVEETAFGNNGAFTPKLQGELQHGTTTLVVSGNGNGILGGNQANVVAVVGGTALQNGFAMTRNGVNALGLAAAIATKD